MVRRQLGRSTLSLFVPDHDYCRILGNSSITETWRSAHPRGPPLFYTFLCPATQNYRQNRVPVGSFSIHKLAKLLEWPEGYLHSWSAIVRDTKFRHPIPNHEFTSLTSIFFQKLPLINHHSSLLPLSLLNTRSRQNYFQLATELVFRGCRSKSN